MTFPAPGGKQQVSTNGGSLPVWSRDGKELFFVSADNKMMAVEVKSGAKLEVDVPKQLFDVRLPPYSAAGYDVSKDGRFIATLQPLQESTPPITVVQNWQAALKK